MAYRCLDCGHIFEDGEQHFWEETAGEYWGTPCFRKYSGCPKCHGEYEEAVACKICGEEKISNECICCVCDDCINEYKNDLNLMVRIGSKETETIKINCFLSSIFDEKEIEDILLKELKENQNYKKINFDNFIDSDRGWFSEKLAEEVKKDENAKG